MANPEPPRSPTPDFSRDTAGKTPVELAGAGGNVTIAARTRGQDFPDMSSDSEISFRPVFSQQLPTRSPVYYQRPDDHARHLQGPSTRLEEAEMLLGLREQHLFRGETDQSAFQRPGPKPAVSYQQQPAFHVQGSNRPDLQSSRVRPSSRVASSPSLPSSRDLQQPDEVSSHSLRVYPRPGIAESVASPSSLGQQRRDLQTVQQPMWEQHEAIVAGKNLELVRLSHTSSSKASDVGSGELQSCRSSPSVHSVCESIQGKIDRIDREIENVSRHRD